MLPYYIDQNEEKLRAAANAVVPDNDQHEVRCGMCARELYVDDEDYRRYREAMESGLDNPCRCDSCSDE